ncbi:nSTAND1 domain-containing NTPase [Nostoc sp. DSM 114159]|jgi:tetratricopeptide (TPR) repeat protein
MEREALVIGINRYPTLIEKSSDRPPHLKAPATDAETIAQILETYGKFHVERLPAAYNQDGSCFVDPQQQVTLKDLETAIVQLFNPPRRSIPDTALLFFAGHGLRKDIGGVTEGFLAASDTCPVIGQWGLSLDWLRKLLQSSPVRQQIVWLDCCYSGELFNFDDADPGSFETKDRCLIAASRGFEVAYEELSGNHGILSGALVEALKPESHSEGWVTNYSLVDLIQQQLKTARQRPIFHNTGGEIILTGQKEKIDRAVLMSELCPYKGLAAFEFDESDPKYFYGRTALTDSLLENIRQGNFLAVVGASGSGKSSVVKAGLLHQLKLGKRLGGSDQWVIKIFRPGEHPLKSLARVFGHHITPRQVQDAQAQTDKPKSELEKTEELLNKGASGLTELVQATLQSVPVGHELEPDANTLSLQTPVSHRLILVIDQFEEVFTLCQNEGERQEFFECLFGALNSSLLTVVMTMRADFFGKCAEQEYAGLAQKIQENLITVTPMNKKELTQAITQPAYQVGLEVQRELVEQMLADVEGPGSLPLLQYTLTELWRKREVNRLTLAEYSRLGGVKGTLQKRADEVYDALDSKEEQLAAKRIFIELTQLGEGTEDTRRQVFKTDLVNSQQSAEVVEQVLMKLTDARLVVTSELQARGESEKTVTVVDVAHEALIRHWPKLRSWVSENRAAIRIERKIEAASEEWESKSKSKDYLFTGSKLAEAENYLQEYGDLGLLSHLASEFVQKSKQHKRNKWVRFGAVASFIGVLTIGAVASTIFGIKSQRLATEATLRENATSIKSSLSVQTNVEQLISAIEATDESKSQLKEVLSEVQSSLLEAVDAVRERNIFSGHTEGVTALAFSPDGQYIVSGSFDNTLRLWDKKGNLLHTLNGHTDIVRALAFSPDGQYIVSGSDDNTLRLWLGGWQGWLKVGCDNLHEHPALLEAKTEDAKAAAQTCLDLANWSNSDKAQFFVNQGQAIASADGDIKTAQAKFDKARKLDSNVAIPSKTEVEQLAASALVIQGEKLLEDGKVQEALVAYADAQKFDPNLKISTDSWNSLCWVGSLRGYAANVMFACEKAVRLEPEDTNSQNSRGLARALTGNTQGAIEDFEAFITSTNDEQQKAQHQGWVNALRSGKNPFTKEEIQRLLNQCIQRLLNQCKDSAGRVLTKRTLKEEYRGPASISKPRKVE